MSILEGIEPRDVFGFFEKICGIPHGSGNTQKISDYLVEFAIARGLEYKQDELGNVIIFKPGTAGYENSAPVIIQGHMDMVCEKEKNCDIDFDNEGLRLKVKDGYVAAEGTTLGGDDGIAVAYALAILDSKHIPHPPLEAVITVDEEIGLLGANALDCKVLKGKTLLNLDSEDEGILLAGCAGGATANCTIPLKYEKSDKYSDYEIILSGITGGHSGVEIHRQGANSNVLMGRILDMLRKRVDTRLAFVCGGLKDNAIPRETRAFAGISKSGSRNEVCDCIDEIGEIISKEYGITDRDIRLEIKETDNHPAYFTVDTEDRVICALRCLPNGVIRMDPNIEGLVQTSLNMGIVKIKDTELIIQFSVRSSVESEKRELLQRIDNLVSYLGGNVTVTGEYPAWEYKSDSRLRRIMVDIYEKMFHEAPDVKTIHAGLECGIFSGKIDNLDCISYGPQIDNIHTTEERLNIDSARRCYEYTKEVLKALK